MPTVCRRWCLGFYICCLGSCKFSFVISHLIDVTIQVLRREGTCPRWWHIRLSAAAMSDYEQLLHASQLLFSSFLLSGAPSCPLFIQHWPTWPLYLSPLDKTSGQSQHSRTYQSYNTPFALKSSAHFLAWLTRQDWRGLSHPATSHESPLPSPSILTVSFSAFLFFMTSVLPDIIHWIIVLSFSPTDMTPPRGQVFLCLVFTAVSLVLPQMLQRSCQKWGQRKGHWMWWVGSPCWPSQGDSGQGRQTMMEEVWT